MSNGEETYEYEYYEEEPRGLLFCFEILLIALMPVLVILLVGYTAMYLGMRPLSDGPHVLKIHCGGPSMWTFEPADHYVMDDDDDIEDADPVIDTPNCEESLWTSVTSFSKRMNAQLSEMAAMNRDQHSAYSKHNEDSSSLTSRDHHLIRYPPFYMAVTKGWSIDKTIIHFSYPLLYM